MVLTMLHPPLDGQADMRIHADLKKCHGAVQRPTQMSRFASGNSGIFTGTCCMLAPEHIVTSSTGQSNSSYIGFGQTSICQCLVKLRTIGRPTQKKRFQDIPRTHIHGPIGLDCLRNLEKTSRKRAFEHD